MNSQPIDIEQNLIPSKEDIFVRNDIRIYYDNEYKIRVSAKSECMDRIIKSKDLVNKINNLPMNKRMRISFGIEIANIYQIAYNSDIESADTFGKNLLKTLEEQIVTYKKIEFIIPCTICAILSIICAIIIKRIIESDYINAFLYGPIGGILSIIINQSDIDINYKVENYILVIESIKKIAVSIIVSIIGVIIVKSGFVFANIDFNSNEYMMYLILIICGYSQSFIPNLLNKLTNNFEKE